jgi:hypothetical protein
MSCPLRRISGAGASDAQIALALRHALHGGARAQARHVAKKR